MAISVVEQGLPALTPFIRQELRVSTGMAALVVASLSFGRIVGSYQAGRFVDAIGERIVLVAGGLAVGVLVLLVAAPLPLGVVIACLIAAGTFSASATPAGSKLVLISFGRRRRGLVMGIRQMGIPAGGLVAGLLLLPAADAWGWRSSLAIAGGIALLGGVGAFLLARRPAKAPRLRRADRPKAVRLREVAQDRDVLLLTVWGCLLVSGQIATVAFVALYCSQLTGVSVAGASGLVVAAQLGGMLGRVVWGAVSDALFRGRRKPLLVAITCAGAGSSLLLALLPRGASYTVFVIAAALAGLFLIGWQGMWMTAISELAGPARAGGVAGFSLTFVAVATTVAAPLYGAVADVSGTLRATWFVLAGAVLLGLVPLAMLRERRVGDGEIDPSTAGASVLA